LLIFTIVIPDPPLSIFSSPNHSTTSDVSRNSLIRCRRIPSPFPCKILSSLAPTEQAGKELRELKEREKQLGQRRPDLRKKSAELSSPKEEKVQDSKISVGDYVKMKGQDIRGEVIQVQGKKCTVVFGHIKTTTKLELLQKLSVREAKDSNII